MNYSYWERQYWFEGNYDLLIVGAGIVGMTAAYLAKQRYPALKIGVVDRSNIPRGASTKNAGFACFGTIGEMLDDLKSVDEAEIAKVLKLRWKGLQRLKALHSPEIIDYSDRKGVEIFRSSEEFEVCADYIDKFNALVLNSIGLKKTFSATSIYLPTGTKASAISNPYEGCLNPVKLIHNLKQFLRKQEIREIYGNSVSSIQVADHHVEVELDNKLSLKASKVLLCTNAFTRDLYSDTKLKPARNLVLVTEKIPDFKLDGCYHYDKGYVYFRSIDNRLLIGGGRNLFPSQEETDQFGINSEIENYLRDFIRNIILGRAVEIDYKWSGIIATGPAKAPLLDKINDHVYRAVRLGGMGVAIGSELSSQAIDMIYG